MLTYAIGACRFPLARPLHQAASAVEHRCRGTDFTCCTRGVLTDFILFFHFFSFFFITCERGDVAMVRTLFALLVTSTNISNYTDLEQAKVNILIVLVHITVQTTIE